MNNGDGQNWGALGVGDVVVVSENEQFPADICILEISDGGRVAYVETKNIDGESNLKSKVCPKLVDGSRLPGDMIGWTI